jgi:hypothetical protein
MHATTMPLYQAKHPENQSLIDALLELAEVEAHSNIRKAGFRARALRMAAQNLAKLEEKITSGQDVAAAGPKKVKGVGKGTAYYIDEFLETGKLSEIEEIKANTKEQGREEKQATTAISGGGTRKRHGDEKLDGYTSDTENLEKEALKKSADDDERVHINRAPVLTLWVTVVSERQGYSHAEALTYGKWVSSMLAQAKGQSLGIFQKKETTSEPKTKSQRTDTDHVNVFSHIKIPVKKVDGKLLAVEKNKEPIDPEYVQGYLERSFGEKDLRSANAAMEKLANSVPPEELRDRAYQIYEDIRPEWHGWGRPGTLDLQKVHELEDEKKREGGNDEA